MQIRLMRNSWVMVFSCFVLAKIGIGFAQELAGRAETGASTKTEDAVGDWIRTSAIDIRAGQNNFGQVDQQFANARLIGLGEATHGQHEVFERKRQLTMHLIRKHGYRIVAYEASVSKMLEASAYVAGESDDRLAAMGGFGMLIWRVEENAALLDDLRKWNQTATKQDQVRLIGVDAQDSGAAQKQLLKLLRAEDAELASRTGELVDRSKAAMKEVMAGNRESWGGFEKEVDEFKKALLKRVPQKQDEASRYALHVQEFLLSLTMYGTPGGRDRSMAELLLMQLEKAGPESRCVLWAHNGHLQLSSLIYLGTEALAMGGHLAQTLGEKYYAVGVAFGEGEFQANAPKSDGSWGFRRYRLSPAPAGSLEAALALADKEQFILDLRTAPNTDAVQNWLMSGHGQRWFGGYAVNDDCDEKTRDASTLLQTFPRADFDCLMYVGRTQAAKPLDAKLIMQVQP